MKTFETQGLHSLRWRRNIKAPVCICYILKMQCFKMEKEHQGTLVCKDLKENQHNRAGNTHLHQKRLHLRTFLLFNVLQSPCLQILSDSRRKNESGGAGEGRTELIGRFFPAGTPVGKIEDTVVKALKLYRRRER